jgi:serine phosphatase RsbU (regulator of sigma subunit)
MVKGHFPCFPLAAAQGLVLVVLNLLEKMKRQNGNDPKQAIQRINETVHQTIPTY